MSRGVKWPSRGSFPQVALSFDAAGIEERCPTVSRLERLFGARGRACSHWLTCRARYLALSEGHDGR